MLTHEQLTIEVKAAADRAQKAREVVRECQEKYQAACHVLAIAEGMYRFAAGLLQKSVRLNPEEAEAMAPPEAKEVCRAEGQ